MVKKKSVGLKIKAMTFPEVMEDMRLKDEKRRQFVADTGLCCVCKEREVVEGNVRCGECEARSQQLVEELRKGSGFMEFRGKGGKRR